MMTSAVQTPDRTLQQRMEALEIGNQIRTYRAQLKIDMKRGTIDPIEKLTDGDPMLETMKVIDLLMAVPAVGRVKADRMLRREQISPSKTVGGLSARQRDALVLALSSTPCLQSRTRSATPTLRLVAA